MALSPNAPFNRPTSARTGNGQAHRRSRWLLPLALVSCLVAPSQAQAQTQNSNAETGKKGAQIYCFMRNSGNNHQVSWDAAYAVIKRQNDKLFKTSPEHAAVMITEAVVQNPSVFPECGRYLGDLFAKPEAKSEASTSPAPSGSSRSERLGQ